ncbi:hypothetical protein CW751_12675 [Brumimicrobium salinarum]|uniref:Uncharacterized protein n=1 Tax=Brumimicrobium salinarum TaxID=2058658 RepID=A0A2I0R016_9FLAO|nr:hypothetical protein [Brumimicrobium salinarum]PKR79931.1 hypothetical protein CW751_12675 [Brumimicrobium salinarum]
MKRIISISLLTLMLSYAFNQLGVFIEYISDVERFTELYCENKDKPEMECNGKCHLADQLAENEEQKQNKELQTPTEILLYQAPNRIEIVQAPECFLEVENNFYFISNLRSGISNTIFQPPRA